MAHQQQSWSIGDIRQIEHTFSDEDVANFAKLSGDENPLHMNEEYAKSKMAGGRVVHGMLAASFVSTLIGMHIPGPGALWNRFRIQWDKMIRIGDTLKISAEVVQVIESTKSLELKISAVSPEDDSAYFSANASVNLLDDSISVTNKKTKTSNITESETSTDNPGIVLVTGASGDIGTAISKALAQQGYPLVMWGRDEEKLSKLQSSIGPKAHMIQTPDLFNRENIESALDEILSSHKVRGIVHTVAAPYIPTDIDSPHNHDRIHEHWQLAVGALSSVCSRVIPNLEEGACIIALSTQESSGAPPAKSSAYVSAKMALQGYVKSLATELGPKGIRANLISPGMVDTPYVKDISSRQKMVEAAKNPLRRLCSAEDVASAALYLFSNDAQFINGVNLPVNGGASMS